MGMTLIEKIIAHNIWAEKVSPGEIVTVNVDRVMVHDIFIPFVADKFEEMGFQKIWDPDRMVLIYDHLVPASQLDDAQIRKATEVCIAAGADFVKTSTGFNGGGATVEAVKAMLETAQGRIKVKPSGGIRNFETAKMYVDMGVDRLGIGYSSCKPIVEGGTSTEAY